MTFGTAIRTCLAKFLHLRGRAGRAEYWWFFLFVLLATGVAQFVDGMMFGFDDDAQPGKHPVTMITSFVLFFPMLSAGWRRMHDTGHPGWYVLLPILIEALAIAGIMIGILGFGLIEAFGADPETLREPAALLGGAGLLVALILVLAASVMLLWWLTRPGDPGPNAYGNPPNIPEPIPAP